MPRGSFLMHRFCYPWVEDIREKDPRTESLVIVPVGLPTCVKYHIIQYAQDVHGFCANVGPFCRSDLRPCLLVFSCSHLETVPWDNKG